MLRVDTVVSEARLTGIIDFLDFVPDIAEDLAQEVFQPAKPKMLDELRYVPGPVKYPIEWVSEKQRRAFFATDGFGGGIPSRRTNTMVNAFMVELKRTDLGFAMVVTNSTDYFPFVVGRLRAKRLSERGWQQPFHANTGWQRISRTIDFWERAFKSEFSARFTKYWETGK